MTELGAVEQMLFEADVLPGYGLLTRVCAHDAADAEREALLARLVEALERVHAITHDPKIEVLAEAALAAAREVTDGR
jgi:hypothetical protein